LPRLIKNNIIQHNTFRILSPFRFLAGKVFIGFMCTQKKDTSDLSQQLAAILENLEQMQQYEKPYLLALYHTHLGELEYQLLTLQVECRSLQRGIEMMTMHLNRGEAVTWGMLQTIRQQVQEAVQQWRLQLEAQAQALVNGKAYLTGMVVIDADTVQRTKLAYRRLAKLLHPDVSPHNHALFSRYWSTVQDAYCKADAELLEALLHIITAATAQDDNAGIGHEHVTRLEILIGHHSQRLADLRNEAPFCWAAQLHDPQWLTLRQNELEHAIDAESGHWANLISRHTKLTADIQPEP
jgi:hypothetical protein